MRKNNLIPGAIALLFGAFAAWAGEENPPAAAPAPLSHDAFFSFAEQIDWPIHEIGLAQFLERMEMENTVILDLRRREDYEQGHIRGAIHLGADITASELEKRIPSKDTTVLLYCSYSLMPVRMIALSHLSLPQLLLHGYKNSYILGPIWMEQDHIMAPLPPELPMEKTPQ